MQRYCYLDSHCRFLIVCVAIWCNKVVSDSFCNFLQGSVSFRVLLCISVNVGAPLFLCLLSSGVPDDTPRLLFVYYLEYHSSFLRFPLRSLPVTPVHPVLPSPFSLLVMLSRLSPRVNILLLHRLVVEYSVISLYIIPPPEYIQGILVF